MTTRDQVLALADYLASREPDHDGDIPVIMAPSQRDLIVDALRRSSPIQGGREAVARVIADECSNFMKCDRSGPGPRAYKMADAILASLPPSTEAGGREAALREFASWVDTWVSNPIGSYSVFALDGLFRMARERLAALTAETPAPDGGASAVSGGEGG